MQVFLHHIYEYQKGLRNLILHTLNIKYLETAVSRLDSLDIPYHIQHVSESKINIFFGADECVNVIKSFGTKSLSEYTPVEDFILGIMLGYEMRNQCKRYLKLKKNTAERKSMIA